jgi:DNA-binding CsgD family transcriptional regulator/PAS domain-containing protein
VFNSTLSFMISVESFSELLQVLYATPLHPDRWPHFLDLLCKHTGSRSNFLICADSSQALSIRFQGGVPYDPSVLADYAAEYSVQDPFVLPLINSGAVGVTDPETLLPRAEMEQSDFYRTMIAPGGYRYPGLVAITCTLRRLEAISFWRSDDEGYLDADSIRLLEMLVPHMQSVMEIRQALGVAELRSAASETIADASNTPAFLLTEKGEILHTNAAARDLLHATDGLLVRNNTLCAANGTMRKQLSALLLQTGRRGGAFSGLPMAKPLSLNRTSTRRPLQLLAAPVSGPRTASVLLLATDPEKPVMLRDEELKEHFGLTPAETEVANGLLTGYSLKEIAAFRRVKLGTIRDQVKSMLAKTGTSRQMDMVKLFLTLPRT